MWKRTASWHWQRLRLIDLSPYLVTASSQFRQPGDRLQDVVDRWKAAKHPIDESWLRRIGPVHFEHVNFRGTIAFDMDPYIDALIERPAKQRVARLQ